MTNVAKYIKIKVGVKLIMDNEKKKNNKNRQSKFAIWWRWPLIVLALSFFLCLAFGILSEVALSGAGLIVSIVVIIVFIAISIIGDMVGVAITAASFQPFRAMAARKVRGAKEAIKLIENKEKVASVSADVIGDICGILSGAAGAAITVIVIASLNGFLEIFLASLISAVIAALTIFGKAFCKKYSIKHNEKIILILGKIISIFCPQKSKKSKKNKKKSNNNDKKQEIDEVARDLNTEEQNDKLAENIEEKE